MWYTGISKNWSLALIWIDSLALHSIFEGPQNIISVAKSKEQLFEMLKSCRAVPGPVTFLFCFALVLVRFAYIQRFALFFCCVLFACLTACCMVCHVLSACDAFCFFVLVVGLFACFALIWFVLLCFVCFLGFALLACMHACMHACLLACLVVLLFACLLVWLSKNMTSLIQLYDCALQDTVKHDAAWLKSLETG